jgi:flagellar basal-body rod protein FlgB
LSRKVPKLWRLGCTSWLRVGYVVGCVIDPISDQIEHYLDLLSARQKLVASNIANADTPGYKAKDIDFQFEFMSMIKNGTPNVIETPGLRVKNDGNNVSMDREARLLSENALRFNLASALMKTRMKLMTEEIQEGKSG